MSLPDVFFQKLDVLIQRAGLPSRRGLSIAAGFKPDYLRTLLRQVKLGKQRIPPDKLRSIAEALKVKPELLGELLVQPSVVQPFPSRELKDAYDLLDNLPPGAVASKWRHTVAGAIADNLRRR
jgi:hypothetical protein